MLSFYDTGAARGGFDAGIQSALRVILTSPKFLFRDEPDPAGAAPGSLYALDDSALASRLAFFLWSAPPDDELLELAAQGKLSDERVFEQQVDRMLADPRASALVENFAGQWLFLRNLRSVTPDVEEFPNFDDNLRQAMRRETELLFANVMREDRPVNELLTADYTFVNERLAKHYGMPSVYGSHFRKVPVADEARRGLLGHASILTVTSYPNRTSPVLRGKWVLENVLGAPPPPPLPNVPALEENEAGKVARTLRERLARASRESRLRDVSRRHGPDRARARELRRHRQVAHARAGRRDRRARPARGRHADRGRGAAARSADGRSRAVRARVHGKAADVRARAAGSRLTTCRRCAASCARPRATTIVSRRSSKASSTACRSACAARRIPTRSAARDRRTHRVTSHRGLEGSGWSRWARRRSA